MCLRRAGKSKWGPHVLVGVSFCTEPGGAETPSTCSGTMSPLPTCASFHPSDLPRLLTSRSRVARLERTRRLRPRCAPLALQVVSAGGGGTSVADATDGCGGGGGALRAPHGLWQINVCLFTHERMRPASPRGYYCVPRTPPLLLSVLLARDYLWPGRSHSRR